MTTYEAVKIEKKIKNNEEVTDKEMIEYLQKRVELNKKLLSGNPIKTLLAIDEKCKETIDGYC